MQRKPGTGSTTGNKKQEGQGTGPREMVKDKKVEKGREGGMKQWGQASGERQRGGKREKGDRLQEREGGIKEQGSRARQKETEKERKSQWA